MPALSLCILWCMFLSGESRKEAICEIAIKTATVPTGISGSCGFLQRTGGRRN